MNYLQKIAGVLSGAGSTPVFGVPPASSALAIAVTASEKSVESFFGEEDAGGKLFDISVYASDYIAAFDMLEQLKGVLKNSGKASHYRDFAFNFDKEQNRYKLSAGFKYAE